jgi:hypothetical protein
VFYGFITGSVVNLIIYVDEIPVASSPDQAVLKAKKSLRALYTIKDLVEAEYLLGVKIEREHNRLKLRQQSNVHSLLERYAMQDCLSSLQWCRRRT